MKQFRHIPINAMDTKTYIKDEALRGGLHKTLLDRIRRNPRYSLRTFARSLGVDASLLSKVLRNERPIGRKFRATVLTKLDAADLGLTIDPDIYSTVTSPSFHKINQWFHFAIMELTRCSEFSEDPRWIASRLGIAPAEATLAWQALVEEGLVVKNDAGDWQPSEVCPTTVGQAPTTAELRRMQRDILNKAIDAMEEYDVAIRDQSTMTMAIRTDLIPLAKERIRQFRRDMNELMQAGVTGNCDAVYNLTIGFYPLTKTDKELN